MSGNNVLLAFDFDHTIIDGNSDITVRQLAPDGKIPQRIKDTYRNDDWTHYMGEIFKVRVQNTGLSAVKIRILLQK